MSRFMPLTFSQILEKDRALATTIFFLLIASQPDEFFLRGERKSRAFIYAENVPQETVRNKWILCTQFMPILTQDTSRCILISV